MTAAPGEPAKLFGRVGATLYDALLLAAVLMLVTALLLPLTGGEAITYETVGVLAYGYRAFLGLVIFLYFGISWTRSGQTLGMRAWKVRVVRDTADRLRWSDTVVRVLVAGPSWLFFGAGILWMLVDPKKLSWQDRASRTRVVKA